MVKISSRVSRILPSGTLAMTQKARELKEKGVCQAHLYLILHERQFVPDEV